MATTRLPSLDFPKQGNTELHLNPFFLLGANPRDSRKRILELADEVALSLDHETCQKARSDLINPRARLVIELAWLPGLSPRRAKTLIQSLSDDPMSVRNEEGIPVLAHCNLLSAAFEAVDSRTGANEVALFAEQLARLVDELDIDVVVRTLNEDRVVSGFPEIKGADQVSEDLTARKRVFGNVIKDALNRLPTNELIDAITLLVENTTCTGMKLAPELIDELVDGYAVETQQFLELEAENIEKLIARIREGAQKGEDAERPIIDQLESVLRNWDKVAQPLQLSFKARGLDHDISQSLAYKVRRLAIDLFNEHNHLGQSYRLTNLLIELFAEIPDVRERLVEDERALSDIRKQREDTCIIEPVRLLCEEISKSADQNPSLAQNEGQRLLVKGKTFLASTQINALSPNYIVAQDLLAATLLHCAVTYGNHTSKWEPCIQLLKTALELANDNDLKQKLRENLAIVEGNHRSLGDLEPINSAPSLYTINGIGVTLYGKTDENPSDGSYMATHYFIFFFIPLFPLARYRVIPTATGYRFLGKGALRLF